MQLSAHVLGLGLGLGLFIILFIVRHMAAQQLLDLVANVTVGPCFRVRVRVRVFHQTDYSAPHGSTTMVRFSLQMQLLAHVLGLGLGLRFSSYRL